MRSQRVPLRALRVSTPDTGVAQLVYAFDDGPELIETVTVPGAPFALDGARAHAVQQALRLLHLIAGVSYYKAAVPEQIRIDSYGIDADTAALLESIYLNGLGEFAYRNGLDLHGRIPLPASRAATDDAAAPALGLRAARAGRHRRRQGFAGQHRSPALRWASTQTVTWIGGSQLIAACAERTGLPDAQHRPRAGAAAVRATTGRARGTATSR